MAATAVRSAHLELINAMPCTPQALEQHKLVRLRELRAVIDAIRCEQEDGDPLLAWAREQGTSLRD